MNGSLSIEPMGGQPPYQINWSTGDTTKTIFGLEAGIYTLSITDANGCMTVQDIVLDALTGTKNIAGTVVEVFPNPLSNQLTIRSNQRIDTIVFYDSLGRIIFRKSEINQSTVIYDTEPFPSGAYWVTIKGKPFFVVKRLVKM